jgi:hypothetical protein
VVSNTLPRVICILNNRKIIERHQSYRPPLPANTPCAYNMTHIPGTNMTTDGSGFCTDYYVDLEYSYSADECLAHAEAEPRCIDLSAISYGKNQQLGDCKCDSQRECGSVLLSNQFHRVVTDRGQNDGIHLPPVVSICCAQVCCSEFAVDFHLTIFVRPLLKPLAISCPSHPITTQ